MANEAKGFSGLSARVSDVGGDIARLGGLAAPKPAPGQAATQSAPRPTASAATQPAPQDDGALRKLLIVGAVVVGVIVLIVANSGGSASGPDTSATDAAAVAPAADATAAAAAAAAADAPSVEAIQEVEPPVADGLALDTNQIAYCLAQKVRLEAAQSAANNSVDAEIDRFNAMVDSYNGRCGHYRYHQSDYDRARAYVDQRRTDFEREGAAPFSTSAPRGSAGLDARSADQDPAASENPSTSEQPQ